jgi:hypothetical protein
MRVDAVDAVSGGRGGTALTGAGLGSQVHVHFDLQSDFGVDEVEAVLDMFAGAVYAVQAEVTGPAGGWGGR